MEKYRIKKWYSYLKDEYIYIPQKRFLFIFWLNFREHYSENETEELIHYMDYFGSGASEQSTYIVFFETKEQAFEFISNFKKLSKNNTKKVKHKTEIFSFEKLNKLNNIK